MRLRQVESQLAEECDRLTVVTEAEVKVFRDFSDADNVVAITNGVDLDYFARPDNHAEEKKCAFVGVLNYKPNADGVIWLCQNVWPKVREQHPDAVFEIVGRSPGPEVLALNEVDGVRVVGPVDDVRPYLWSAAAVVAPLLIARGVQNKVLEAFAASRPVISSPPALVGLDLKLGTHALRAEAPDEWVSALGDLFANEHKRAPLGDAARQWVTEHHRWDACLKDFDRLLETQSHSPNAGAMSVAHT